MEHPMPGSRRNAPPPQSIVEAWILKAHGKSAQAVWRAVALAFHFHQPSSHSVNIGPHIPVPFSAWVTSPKRRSQSPPCTETVIPEKAVSGTKRKKKTVAA